MEDNFVATIIRSLRVICRDAKKFIKIFRRITKNFEVFMETWKHERRRNFGERNKKFSEKFKENFRIFSRKLQGSGVNFREYNIFKILRQVLRVRDFCRKFKVIFEKI